MSGAQGHLFHPYEDFTLKISELCKLFQLAQGGDSQNPCIEKIDGINMLFRFDGMNLRFARSHSDLKTGGIELTDLLTRFKDEPGIGELTHSAMSSLTTYFKENHIASRRFINEWLSCDIVSREYANVILYDRNAIVVHPLRVNHTGELVPCYDICQTIIKNECDDWLILPPKPIHATGTFEGYKKAFTSIGSLPANLGMSQGDHTLGDIYRHNIELMALDANIPDYIRSYVVARIMKDENYLTLTQLKKKVRYDFEFVDIQKFVKDEKNIIKRARADVENIIHNFSVQLLCNTSSILVTDLIGEANRIREMYVSALDKHSGTKLDSFVQYHSHRLGPITNINSTIEGIVVFYDDKKQFYKFTSWFAPVAQVLGIDRHSYR